MIKQTVLRGIFLLLVTAIAVQIIVVRSLITRGEALRDMTTAYEQHPPQPTSYVLMLGDSSAVGVGASEPSKSVAGLYGADHPDADITNIAVSGAKVADLPEQLAMLDDQHYDLVFLHIGGNDIVRFTNIKKIEQGVRAIIATLRDRADRIVILHGGDVGTAKLLPAISRPIYTSRTYDVRERYRKIASEDEKVVYANIIDAYGDPVLIATGGYYANDYFHPSDAGYAVWYQQIQAALAQ